MKRRTWNKWVKIGNRLFWIGFVFIAVLLVLSIVVNYFAPGLDQTGESERNRKQLPALNEAIWEYQPIVEKYAKEYGIEDQTNLILAMMMQESGGRGTDPMQSSESLCGEIGCIDNPERSIEQGIYFFSLALQKADGDVLLAVQAYNFGHGFIEYVQDMQDIYSEDAAIAYSQKMYEEAGKENSIYTCRREEAQALEACYGDIYYVSSVMSYKEAIEIALKN